MCGLIYQVVPKRENRADAFAKAPGDIYNILHGKGVRDLELESNINPGIRGRIGMAIKAVKNLFVMSSLPRASVVVFQCPSTLQSKLMGMLIRVVRRVRGIKFVSVIHDIPEVQYVGSLREVTLNSTARLIGLADCSIVHNDCMREFLVSNGIDARKLVVLEAFDYLRDQDVAMRTGKGGALVVAGRLSVKKAPYLNYVDSLSGLHFNLYGICNDSKYLEKTNVTYKGCFSPDELPGKLEGGWGLVWDGTSINGCMGPAGEYLRINNPHKASLYLSAGLPIIVWKQSAMARFVERHKVGLTVESLSDIRGSIERMTDAEYAMIAKNVDKLSQELSTGRYSGDALERALDTIGRSHDEA